MSIDDLVTTVGNAVFASVALSLALVSWLQRAKASTKWGRMVLSGLTLALIAVGIRVGMWVPALLYSSDGERYAPWVFEVRQMLTLSSALLFVCGCGLVHAALSRHEDAARGIAIVALVAAMSVTGVVYLT